MTLQWCPMERNSEITFLGRHLPALFKEGSWLDRSFELGRVGWVHWQWWYREPKEAGSKLGGKRGGSSTQLKFAGSHCNQVGMLRDLWNPAPQAQREPHFKNKFNQPALFWLRNQWPRKNLSICMHLCVIEYLRTFVCILVVGDTQSDSIQCLNFAKKLFIQYSIQYCFTRDSIQNIIQFKINSADSFQKII